MRAGLVFASAVHAARERVMGVMPHQTPRTLLAYHQPLARYLESGLKRPLRRVTAPDVKTFGQRILHNEYDLVLAPLDIYLDASRHALNLKQAEAATP